MRDQAIINTHPSVVRVVASTDAYDVNGNLVVLDEAVIDTEFLRLQTEQANAVAQKAADKESANQKLRDLGLTDAEIKVLTGN